MHELGTNFAVYHRVHFDSLVSAEPPHAPLPNRIGRYRPCAVLGSGGMAMVYLADRGSGFGSGRWCALKVLNEDLVRQESFMSMFATEAKIGSEITHPHVCGVFDFGEVNGRPYLAMEYVRGKSLAQIARACGSPPQDPVLHAARLARVLADACEGLQAIHQHHSAARGPLPVIHRDISPDNLVLSFDGFVKVIDFGLAKAQHHGDKTQPGIIKGKLSYVAPELLKGESPNSQNDIWSLGVVAWELLTGKRLFNATTDALTLAAVLEQEIIAPSRLVPGLPESLDSIVLRALRRDPSERYASAADMADELWAWLAEQASIIQHRELASWLQQLFPVDFARIEALMESIPLEGSRAIEDVGTLDWRLPSESLRPESQLALRGALASTALAVLRRVKRLSRAHRASPSARALRIPPVISIGAGIALTLGSVGFYSQWGWSRDAVGDSAGGGAQLRLAARAALPVAENSSAGARGMHAEPQRTVAFEGNGVVVHVERTAGTSELILHIRPAPDRSDTGREPSRGVDLQLSQATASSRSR